MSQSPSGPGQAPLATALPREPYLTPMQQRIFRLLLDPELTAPDISVRAKVSLRSVRFQSDQIYQRLGICGGRYQQRRLVLLARYGAPWDRVAELESRVRLLEGRMGAAEGAARR